MKEPNTKCKEDRARRELKKQGYRLKKSRTNGFVYRNGIYQGQNPNDYGGYMIINATTNVVEEGERLDLSLEDVERWISER